MLKRISKFFKTNKHSNNAGAYVYGPSEHSLSPDMINRDAHNVVDVLQKAGFEAYVVGGCVRDLLLGLKPKDFDVATSAKPCLLYTSPSPRDQRGSRMPSSA